MAKRTSGRGNDRSEADVEDTDLMTRAELAIDKVFAARDEMGGGVEWSVVVSRLSGPEKRDGRLENRLFQKTLDELPFINEFLSEEYGEGVYRVRVRRDRSIFSQWDICIEHSPAQKLAWREKLRALNDPLRNLSPHVSGGGDSGGGGLAAILMQQTEMIRQMLERQASPPNPIDTFGSVAAAFKSFQDLMPKPEVSTGVDMFTKGMELAKEIMADRDAPAARTGVLDLVRDAMNNPNIGEAVGAFLQTIRQPAPIVQQQQPQQQPQRVAPQAPRPASLPAQQAPAGPAPAAEPNQAMVEQAIDYLVNQAKAGVQPQLFADQALSMMPNGLLEELEAADDMLTLLIDRFSQIEPHRLWFDALLSDMFPPVVDGEPDAAPADLAAAPEPMAAG